MTKFLYGEMLAGQLSFKQIFSWLMFSSRCPSAEQLLNLPFFFPCHLWNKREAYWFRVEKKISLIFIFLDLLLNKQIISFFSSVTCRFRCFCQNLCHAYIIPVFCSNLMHLIFRILKLRILTSFGKE
jgi:hypothetical protein